MTNTEIIATIRNEIERLMDEYKPIVGGVDELTGAHIVLAKLLSFLDTLEEKSEKPNKHLEGLDEAAEEYEKKHTYQRYDGGGYTPEYDATLAEAFKAGAEWMKEQMMKEAVEGEVIKTDKHTSVRYKSFYGTDRYFYGIADKQFKPGDKVRIIIIKDDGKE